MKPNHEKKNTRPYMLMGLKRGIARALRVMGFTSGARNGKPKSMVILLAVTL